MKCSKCNHDMRLWTNPQNGQQMASCDNCRYDMPIYNSSNVNLQNNNAKVSGLSIIAFIFSFLGCMSFVGLILGIIDIAKKDKVKQKHGLSIAAIIISVIWIIIFVFASLSPSSEEEASGSIDTQTVYESSEELDTELDTELATTTEQSEDATESVSEITENISTEETTESALSREEFIALCEPANYKTLARYPDEHIGDKITLTVQISQIIQGGLFDDGQYYRVYTDNDGYGYYDDEYFMYDMRIDDDTRLLETDIITIYGEYAGLEEVTRALTGTKEYVPAIKAYYIDILE